jgi:WD40 repeat protein
LDHYPLLQSGVIFSLLDKGGDVFRFDLKDNSSVCLLGHLSMLLDVTLSACGKYVITCDRDEKIRVSHYPNAYNIHNFCLGHTEFVTGIALCPHNPSLVCSASGDGTVRVWDFLNGLQLGSKVCSEDVSSQLQSLPETDRMETHSNGSSRNESVAPRVKRSPIPAVKSLKCKQLSETESLIIVTIER